MHYIIVLLRSSCIVTVFTIFLTEKDDQNAVLLQHQDCLRLSFSQTNSFNTDLKKQEDLNFPEFLRHASSEKAVHIERLL